MKQFNTFAELSVATVLTGTPVRILSPAIVDGVVEATGDGLTLVSGNVFVPRFDTQEILTGRHGTIIDDSFPGNLTSSITTSINDTTNGWTEDSEGTTSTVFYKGQLWWPMAEIPFRSGGYVVTDWNIVDNILQVTVDTGTVYSYSQFSGIESTGEETEYVDLASYIQGTMSGGERLFSYRTASALTIPKNLSGSLVYAEVAPTGLSNMYVDVDGTTVGIIEFQVGVHEGSFSSDNNVEVPVGGKISLINQDDTDTTLADISLTLRCIVA